MKPTHDLRVGSPAAAASSSFDVKNHLEQISPDYGCVSPFFF